MRESCAADAGGETGTGAEKAGKTMRAGGVVDAATVGSGAGQKEAENKGVSHKKAGRRRNKVGPETDGGTQCQRRASTSAVPTGWVSEKVQVQLESPVGQRVVEIGHRAHALFGKFAPLPAKTLAL